jgi:two-component system KDP operon response regulator KdpE
LSGGRIIVVDDQPKIRRFMRTTLVAEGYEVDEAKTGEEAAGVHTGIATGSRSARHEHARHGRFGRMQGDS